MTLVQRAASSDWPPESIHLEYFAADPTTKLEVAREFVIKLARSNREFVIPPTKSIVQVLIENHIWIDFSCEAGIWPAPGSEDTELGVLMELEVGHGKTEVYAGVQA